MNRYAIAAVAVVLGCSVPLACSSSSKSGAGGGGVDASTDGSDAAVVNDPLNCIPPGTPNNAAGVGGYCTPNGGQCANAGPDAEGTICTADFGTVVPAHAWFCTTLCEIDASVTGCGENGPPCVSAEGEFVCLPAACSGFLTALEEAGAGAGDGGTASDGH
ncbi:MAG TPA: hypothetical protein VGG39_18500 [Polyangiaceae bacterium]